MSRNLILLGASVRAAAFSALRAGSTPYAIDLFADRDLTAICPALKIDRYPGDFLRVLATAPDAPWLYTGGLENFQRLVDRLAAIRPLLGNGGKVLRAIRNPWRLAEAVRDCGLPFPRIARSAREIAGVEDNQWLSKPRRGSGGASIRFASSEDLIRPSSNLYFQQYIHGQAISAVFVGTAGRAVLLGTSRQLMGREFEWDRPFLYGGSIAPLRLRDKEQSQLTALGDVLATRFGLCGLFNIDLVRTNEGLWPVEVNPRYSASIEILERVTNLNFIELHIEACQSRTIPAVPTIDAPRVAGKTVVYARGHCVIPPEFEELIRQWNAPGRPPNLADLPAVGQRFAAHQPVTTAFAEGSDPMEVEAELRKRVALVSRIVMSK